MANKKELINMMSVKSGLSKTDAAKALDAFIDSVTEYLIIDEKVQLIGFGTFEARQRKAREGRNPRNPQQVIEIPAHKAPVFKAGKILREAIR